MSDDALPGPDAPALPRDPNLSRPDHGARPPQFVPIASVTAGVAPEAMDRLRRAGIGAHLESRTPDAGGVLSVDAADAHDARTVLATLDDGVGAADALDARPAADDTQSVDDAFAALVSHLDIDTSWTTGPPSNGRPSTRPAPSAPSADPHITGNAPEPEVEDTAEAVSRRLHDDALADPPELREEHYEPPPPPPVPRPGGLALVAIAIILGGIAVLAFGTSLGIAPDQTLPLGIIAVLTGSTLLVARLKRHRDDEDDDGAVL